MRMSVCICCVFTNLYLVTYLASSIGRRCRFFYELNTIKKKNPRARTTFYNIIKMMILVLERTNVTAASFWVYFSNAYVLLVDVKLTLKKLAVWLINGRDLSCWWVLFAIRLIRCIFRSQWRMFIYITYMYIGVPSST